MSDKKMIKLKKETYLKMIKNAPGTKIFNSLIVMDKETKVIMDILENGTYSGAYFVSSILYLLNMIKAPHETVTTLKTQMIEAGFTEVGEEDYESGDVLIYEEMIFDDGTKSDQAGFYIGQELAVSTSYHEKMVIEHHYTFGVIEGKPTRKIINAYRPNYDEDKITYGDERS
jgi:hypothetical protein